MTGNDTCIGLFTKIYLREETPKSIQQMRELDQSSFERSGGSMSADYTFSIYEASNILIKQEEKSPRELLAFQRECSSILDRINNRPEQWNTDYLTAEVARAWFTQQIETLREAVVAAQ
jgi:hypothetical protein